eukprot:CAMPEP_0118658676 /NCGR_PEP_ID=MMETSP0785-20121206/14699_1 /TAXON_ID=91992 /ORGANISM="Bolidomonas pacifica, Strain CCMP 1866" /LENGTH=164 /DNA_ID=CAMNT_0006551717 /DNA_START=129 /DNA_END=620 /DNA_ORIENTATION=+
MDLLSASLDKVLSPEDPSPLDRPNNNNRRPSYTKVATISLPPATSDGGGKDGGDSNISNNNVGSNLNNNALDSSLPVSSAVALEVGDATLVPKHNLGNYTQSLPRLSSRERIQKYTTDRFMSSESRALLRKFAGEKQLEDVHQVVEVVDDGGETILKGLEAGMT